MKIANIIEMSSDNFGIKEILEDREFDTLGLVGIRIDYKVCTFIEDEKYIDNISESIVMVITTYKILDKIKDMDIGICVSENPRISYFKLHNYLCDKEYYRLTDNFKTRIEENCDISNLAYIAQQNVMIGKNVTIEEFVSIKENTIIGDNTIIRAGAVIGSEGFEFKLTPSSVLAVKHVGWTEIGSEVEIQYNTCIDKAVYPWDKTTIGDYSKISNLVQISHGVKLGSKVLVTAGVIISGRTIIKDNSRLGVGAILSNALTIGDSSKVNIGSVVTKNVEDYSSVSGNFAIDHKKFIEFIKSIR